MVLVAEMKQEDAYLPITQQRGMIPQSRWPEDPVPHGPLAYALGQEETY